MPTATKSTVKVTPEAHAEVITEVETKLREHIGTEIKAKRISMFKICRILTDGFQETMSKPELKDSINRIYVEYDETPSRQYIESLLTIAVNATDKHYQRWDRNKTGFKDALKEFTKSKPTPAKADTENKSWSAPDMGTEERSETQDKEMQEETKTHTPTHKPTAPPPSTKPKPTEASSFERAMNIVQDHFERDSSKKDIFMYKMHDDGTFTQSDHFRWAQNHDKVYSCYSKTTEEMVTMRSNAVELDEEISEKESQENAA